LFVPYNHTNALVSQTRIAPIPSQTLYTLVPDHNWSQYVSLASRVAGIADFPPAIAQNTIRMALKPTRRVYSAEELHRLRDTTSQPRLREAIEGHDGDDVDVELVKGTSAPRSLINNTPRLAIK